MDGDEKVRVYWHPLTAIVSHFEFTPGLTQIGHSKRQISLDGQVQICSHKFVTKLGQLQIWIGVNFLAQQTQMEGGRLTGKLNLQELICLFLYCLCVPNFTIFPHQQLLLPWSNVIGLMLMMKMSTVILYLTKTLPLNKNSTNCLPILLWFWAKNQ